MKNFVKSIATAAVVGCAVLLVLLVGVFVLLIIAPKRLVKIAYVVFLVTCGTAILCLALGLIGAISIMIKKHKEG